MSQFNAFRVYGNRFVFLVLVLVTLFFSFSPGSVSPAFVVNNDKLAHFVVFFGLTFWLKFSFPGFFARKLFFIMAFLAASIEVFQYLFAGRELSFFDFGAGVLGVFVYLVVLRICGWR